MTKNTPLLVLASASPRRRELLHQVGIACQVCPSDVEESPLTSEKPHEFVLRLSREKAQNVANRHAIEGRYFLGSDTIVVHEGAILGKPETPEEAAIMLNRLSDAKHQVISGYAIIDRATGQVSDGAVVTDVWFRALTSAEIDGYIATGEPMDKAGAYGIQGIGAFMVRRIDGSYSNVVGLPLCEVIQALQSINALHLFKGEHS